MNMRETYKGNCNSTFKRNRVLVWVSYFHLIHIANSLMKIDFFFDKVAPRRFLETQNFEYEFVNFTFV